MFQSTSGDTDILSTSAGVEMSRELSTVYRVTEQKAEK